MVGGTGEKKLPQTQDIPLQWIIEKEIEGQQHDEPAKLGGW
jgi:hypothetical protein